MSDQGHGGDGPRSSERLAGHFDDLGQQRDASILGMWAFLATELMLFGGLFTSYAVCRSLYGEEFLIGSRRLDPLLGGINTVILLTSSFTIALGVRCGKLERPNKAAACLGITALLGIAFLVLKGFEYNHEYTEGLIPWLPGSGRGEAMGPPETLFLTLYFFMTGLHAFHMIVGVVVVGTVAVLCRLGWFSGGGGTQVEATGLYWHFVDLAWVFLYPLLYLPGLAPRGTS